MEKFLQFLKFRKDDCEYPTLLHFSAAHGLEQLTCALLDCPGAQAALQIRSNKGDIGQPQPRIEFEVTSICRVCKEYMVKHDS